MRSYGSLRRWAPLLLPAAEFTWISPWLLLASGGMDPGGAAALLPSAAFAALLGGYLLEQVPASEGAVWRTRLAVLAGGLAVGLGAVWLSHYHAVAPWSPAWLVQLLREAHDVLPEVPSPVLGALAAPLLIWRGMVLGSREFSHFAADAAFRRGLAWSVLFALIFTIFQGSRGFALVRPVAAFYLLAFVFLSLVMLSVARLLGLWSEAEARGSAGGRPNRPWLALAVGVPGLIILAGAMAADLAGAEVWPYIRPVLMLLAPLLEAVFIVLFFVAGIIARILLFALSRIPQRQPVVLPDNPASPFDEMLRRMRDFHPSPEAVSDARWGLVALAVLLLSMIILFAAVRRRRRAEAEDLEDRESVWDRGALRKALRRFFMRGASSMAAAEPADGPERAAVRRLYLRVLEAARAAGFARSPAQTPEEFREYLNSLRVVEASPLAGITRAYEMVRYGAHQPSPEEVRMAAGDAHRTEAALRGEPGGESDG